MSQSQLSLRHDQIIFISGSATVIRRRGVVGRIPDFQPGGPGSIPGGARNSKFLSFVCVLSCAVFGRGPDIVLTTHSGRPVLVHLSSVLVHRQLLLLQASDSRAFGCKSLGV